MKKAGSLNRLYPKYREMKIVTVIGARPQFIKAAAVSRAIANHQHKIEEIIVHTGQHYDKNMSDIFFDELKIKKPTYNLGISGTGHGEMTGDMLKGIEKILLEEKPDVILIYGDTNSTLAASIAGSKLHIPIAHVEAGLRSFNMHMPEEINRILSDRVSKYLFCPTDTAIKNLKTEGFPFKNQHMVNVGDVMEDAALFYKHIAAENLAVLNTNNIESGNYNLATIHRAENTDNPIHLKNMVEGLNEISKQKQVIVPLHPRTKKKLQEQNLKIDFTIIDPVGYLDMINLINHSFLVVTDSGGLQKEAFFFNKFCITMREETEWVELVNGGFNMLVGSNKNKMAKAYAEFSKREFKKTENYYGGGKASENIVEYLLKHN